MPRVASTLLRLLAFGLIVALAAVALLVPEIEARFGGDAWISTLLPRSPASLAIWALIASLNAGAAFQLAAYLDS